MRQLVFKFPFKTNYYNHDFYVSNNNFDAYKLIESYDQFPIKLINICGPHKSGKSHLAEILKKKLFTFVINAKKINSISIENFSKYKAIIVDDYYNSTDVNPNIFYSIINQSIHLEQFLIVNSLLPLVMMKQDLKDLQSRFESFLTLKIGLPNDELLKIIIQKNFSDRQLAVDAKIIDYIVKNIERSYEGLTKFVEEIDNLSLSSGKSINIKLIKQILKKYE